jgi:RNA polymerase sigma factor (sigma-70 family)
MQQSEDQLRAWMTEGMDGDAAAHAALLRALVPMLRGFYRRRLAGAGDDIEDLVQETLIAVHTRRESYDRTRPFVAWLYAIARYRMIDHLRRTTIPVESLDDILASEGFEDACAARIDVARLLSVLPPKQARAIRDTHIDGLSVAEAAEAAHIGQSDVKVSVHRGMKALMGRIRGERA